MNPEAQTEQPTQPQPPQPTQANQPLALMHDYTELFAILSLVLPFAGFAIFGLVLGILSLRRSKAQGRKNSLAIAGVIVSSIAVVLSTITIILFVVLFGHIFQKCHDLGPGTHQVGNSTYTCS